MNLDQGAYTTPVHFNKQDDKFYSDLKEILSREKNNYINSLAQILNKILKDNFGFIEAKLIQSQNQYWDRQIKFKTNDFVFCIEGIHYNYNRFLKLDSGDHNEIILSGHYYYPSNSGYFSFRKLPLRKILPSIDLNHIPMIINMIIKYCEK